jgi:alcohol dehydrogenase
MMVFEHIARTSVVFGPGSFGRLGRLARDLGFRRTLVVSDHGIRRAGFVATAEGALATEGIDTICFHDFGENPDSAQAEAGRAFAAPHGIDSILGLGGGSSLDCAKAINFLLTNGGSIRDYRGHADPPKPMLPMIGVPTTTGTGTEAQSYALISDAATHVKMACGASGAAFRIVLLDPELAASQPPNVLAATGYDAIAHAVESFVTTKHNFMSDCYSREAWRLLSGSFLKLLSTPGNIDATSAMQMGAYLAGAAIEHSMLGATHATANPLTARFGITHGRAIALMLDHVVAWNRTVVGVRYDDLAPELEKRLDQLAHAAGLQRSLREAGVPESLLTQLAEDASHQWTGKFNPRPFDQQAALEIYRCAY